MFMVNIEEQQRLYVAESVDELVQIIYSDMEKDDLVVLGKMNCGDGKAEFVVSPSTGMYHVTLGLEFAVKPVDAMLICDLAPNTPYWEPGSQEFKVLRKRSNFAHPVYRLTWEQFQRGYA